MPSIAIDARMMGASGIGVVLDNLLRRLIPRRPDWNFRLFGEVSALAHLAADHVEVEPFTAKIYSLGEQRLGRMLSRAGADLAWSPHYNIPLFWRGPLLVTVHDVLHLAHPELFAKPAQRAYARLMFSRVKRQANGIAFVSQYSADEFHRLVGAPRGQSLVIHNGVEAGAFQGGGASLHLRPYILFVGNIKPHKNLRRLVEAFRLIADRVPHDLVLVGRREGFITAEDGLGELVTGDARITFTGEVDAHCLAAWYGNADALVMPSYYEGFGLPPLEAFAAGCPVLAARATSLPEICGDAAMYCDPFSPSDMAEKLLALLTDMPLRDRLRGAGLARVNAFGWDAAAAAYLAAIEALL